MKKIIIIVAVVSLFIGGGVFAAKQFTTVKATSTAMMEIDLLPVFTVKKFTDGNIVCYLANNGTSMSCLKK